MSMLKRIRSWWRQFWGADLYWPVEVDTHRWENKTEILRRLSNAH